MEGESDQHNPTAHVINARTFCGAAGTKGCRWLPAHQVVPKVWHDRHQVTASGEAASGVHRAVRGIRQRSHHALGVGMATSGHLVGA